MLFLAIVTVFYNCLIFNVDDTEVVFAEVHTKLGPFCGHRSLLARSE
jgi:hypothetical protein